MGTGTSRPACAPWQPSEQTRKDQAILDQQLTTPQLDEYNNVSYTDADLLVQAIANQNGRIDMSHVARMPFLGWPYTRRLLFGCWASETDVLAATQHPQWVPARQLTSYHRLPHPFPVWVNYTGFGAAVATHFQVVYATSRPIVWLCCQALRPFGAQEFNGYRDGNTYRVLSEWCLRMPAAAVSILDGFVTLAFANGQMTNIELARFVNPKGTCYDGSLRVARAALLQDYPNQANLIVGFVYNPDLLCGVQIDTTGLEHAFVLTPTQPPTNQPLLP